MDGTKLTVCPDGHGNVRLQRVGSPGQVLLRGHLDDEGGLCPWSEAPLPPGYRPPAMVDEAP